MNVDNQVLAQWEADERMSPQPSARFLALVAELRAVRKELEDFRRCVETNHM